MLLEYFLVDGHDFLFKSFVDSLIFKDGFLNFREIVGFDEIEDGVLERFGVNGGLEFFDDFVEDDDKFVG